MRARKRPYLPILDRSLELFARLRPPSWIFKMSRLASRLLYRSRRSIPPISMVLTLVLYASAVYSVRYNRRKTELDGKALYFCLQTYSAIQTASITQNFKISCCRGQMPFVACGRMKLTDPNRKLCRQNGAT